MLCKISTFLLIFFVTFGIDFLFIKIGENSATTHLNVPKVMHGICDRASY